MHEELISILRAPSNIMDSMLSRVIKHYQDTNEPIDKILSIVALGDVMCALSNIDSDDEDAHDRLTRRLDRALFGTVDFYDDLLDIFDCLLESIPNATKSERLDGLCGEKYLTFTYKKRKYVLSGQLKFIHKKHSLRNYTYAEVSHLVNEALKVSLEVTDDVVRTKFNGGSVVDKELTEYYSFINAFLKKSN